MADQPPGDPAEPPGAAGPVGAAGRRPPVRVLLADPAPLQRAGLRALLTAPDAGAGPAPAATSAASADTGSTATATGAGAGAGAAEIVIAGEAADGVDALDLARRLLPDVLVTELALPRLDGLAVIRAITEARLPVRILVVTDEDTDDRIVAAAGAGATGYLCKDAPHDQLTAAVRAVAAGGAVIAPQLLARVLRRLTESLPARSGSGAAALDALTSREREVLVHVARGLTNTEIAEVLQVSETTVKTHVGHVLTKLRLRDRTQAVVLAYETGLVKPGGPQDGR
ncbi:putative two-component system response regulator [Actinoplanes missouriensis 431]|uniref:Putative two-component system response regulator n=1 Tax=Actinoplanes missouriensis (strain ATCC 14538 / DSM 43046 / CBS 188.64 / JCM 3121 / NBRC 102363 / NCIMB 12654 / NRRL B-3342 / UNCC 431) TaxID=512565 RepID=I0HC52_ACTM4|nr:response regulator transcription factor [Actinoplanes missouriensis]BAL90589.1 putative two-component system response regulator [Actinoplanes missouriensis 431]